VVRACARRLMGFGAPLLPISQRAQRNLIPGSEILLRKP
jgi:hypothetical protein